MNSSFPSRLLFIGLAFHVRTNSSAFFVELLSQTFEVSVVSIDPQETFDVVPLLDAGFKVVCLWQLDYLAPIFASRDIRTIVVPMYDGSSILPDRHWLQMQGCRFFNFSLNLHERLTALGLDSVSLQYFPDPSGVTQVRDFHSKRLFFWQRAPDSFLNVDNILRLFASKVDHIHIHAAADDGRDDVIRVPAGSPPLTLSRWFETQEEYLATLECSNIFVAPRLSEGVGQAFLEAMARGLAVVAYALPTHTEYLQQGHNGFLFSERASENNLDLNNLELKRIGCNARRSVGKGHENWRVQAMSIGDLIRGMSASTPRHRTSLDDKSLIEAYRAGVDVYSAYLNTLA